MDTTQSLKRAGSDSLLTAHGDKKQCVRIPKYAAEKFNTAVQSCALVLNIKSDEDLNQRKPSSLVRIVNKIHEIASERSLLTHSTNDFATVDTTDDFIEELVEGRKAELAEALWKARNGQTWIDFIRTICGFAYAPPLSYPSN